MFFSNVPPSRRRRAARRAGQSATPTRRSRSPRRLRLENLEDRQLLSAVSGQVFNDLNADGAKNAGESGQSGWTIYLDANTNGQLDPGETSTTTLADGSYTFNGLAAGTYNVAEVQQAGWQQTSPPGTAPSIGRVSVAPDGTEGNDTSWSPSINADGRYVAFNSFANNLVPNDTNGTWDVFVYDRQSNSVERVSVAADGTEGNANSYTPSISADGRYVAFDSTASNLVPDDSGPWRDIFVYDRQTDTIERISVAADGTQGNGHSNAPSISADGRYVAFESSASNLVPGDTNGQMDIFVYDRQTHSIERVNLAADGTQANGTCSNARISDDGSYVVFASSASNLVPGDTNGTSDVFGYDLWTRTLERVSVSGNGTQGNGSSSSYGDSPISADGRYVTFDSSSSNLVPSDTNGLADIFVYDRQAHAVERVSVASDGTQANGASFGFASLSDDGRYVAFRSFASNLVPGDTNGANDVFLYDRQTEMIARVSHAADGTQANSASTSYSISGDGRSVAFYSMASNLVPGDTNGVNDVFVTANPFAPVPGSRVVTVVDGQDVSEIDFGNNSLATKFYVVNDAAVDRTYEYNATGTAIETYGLGTANTAPRGAASTTAGDRTWVVDANRKVYVYNTSGALLGSWTAGTLSTTATVEGIATNGTDVWIVDAKSDKVYKYTGAASRLSGSQNAASSFSLNSGNTSPKDIVTDGTILWVVNDSTTDKVFKYTTAGALLGSWTISTAGATAPTGITVDPSNVSNIWIVDSVTKLVYQYNAAASRTSGSQAAAVSFALATGNTNPQGIADPPAAGSEVATPRATSAPALALAAADAAILSLGNSPVKADNILSPVSTKPTAEWNVSRPTASYRPTPTATVQAAPTKPAAKLAGNRGLAVRAADHAFAALTAGDREGELALPSPARRTL